MADVVVLGNFVVDIIGKPIDRLPEPGQLLLIDTLETHVGGNGPNTAGALAKLGGSVAVCGRVGEDLYGRFLVRELEAWGVETAGVVRDPASVTGVTLVAVDESGERSFIHHFGANAAFGVGDLDWEFLERASHLHLASFFVLPALDGTPAAEILTEARRRGIGTSLDVCWDREGRWMERLAPCLPHVDYFLPSLGEAARLTGEQEPEAIAAALLDHGCRSVILTSGPIGCLYADRHGALEAGAYHVEVVDTTGAGDCFVAGFLYGLQQGWGIERCVKFGNACGARSVTHVGAVTGMAPAAEIERWALEQRYRPIMTAVPSKRTD